MKPIQLRTINLGTVWKNSQKDVLTMDVLSLRTFLLSISQDVLSLQTFCPHRSFVCRMFCPNWCFVSTNVLSLRTFCPMDVMSPAVLSPDVLSPDVLSLDVLSPDVLSLWTFCLQTFCLGTFFFIRDGGQTDFLNDILGNFSKVFQLSLFSIPVNLCWTVPLMDGQV
jgi:hypothetical protein